MWQRIKFAANKLSVWLKSFPKQLIFVFFLLLLSELPCDDDYKEFGSQIRAVIMIIKSEINWKKKINKLLWISFSHGFHLLFDEPSNWLIFHSTHKHAQMMEKKNIQNDLLNEHTLSCSRKGVSMFLFINLILTA